MGLGPSAGAERKRSRSHGCRAAKHLLEDRDKEAVIVATEFAVAQARRSRKSLVLADERNVVFLFHPIAKGVWNKRSNIPRSHTVHNDTA